MTSNADQPRRVLILGSTGSIGTQTLDVIAHLNALHARGEFPRAHEVVGLAAGRNADALAEQAHAHPNARLALADESVDYAGPGDPIRGDTAALELVHATEADLVVAAMVGAAGLPPTLAAVEAGTDVALANKETLVVAGTIVTAAAERTGARLLPVDSEHAGVWQTLRTVLEPKQAPPVRTPPSVARVIITASGGAFRDKALAEIEDATPDQALAHPTWNMGPKVTIDSATMMNKGLELIEAHHLFGLTNDRLGVLIHRQSAVHALAQLRDGGIIAHISATDMRSPILTALAHPFDAPAHPAAALDAESLTTLDFEKPDPARFPALDLARRVIDQPNTTAGAIFNAANEAAVAAFLDRRIPFGSITRLVERTLDALDAEPLTDIPTALDADARARASVEDAIRAHAEV
jgi:1-deoxy-D-xylulose-5-phosphate reductoisomerase